jgi:ketosteroid isomerase-like protein
VKKAMQILLATLCLITFANGQTPKSEDVTAAEKEIMRLRKLLWEPTAQSDYQDLARIYADDYIWISIHGGTGGKPSSFPKGKYPEGFSQKRNESEVKFRLYGDTAIITGLFETIITNEGKTNKTIARITEVWVKRGGHWQIVSQHATQPQPKPQTEKD